MTTSELKAVNYMIDNGDYCERCKYLPKDFGLCKYCKEEFREHCIEGIAKTYEQADKE